MSYTTLISTETLAAHLGEWAVVDCRFDLANESWGRYWGWDSKEVGALVAWMAYAGFLHTRIAHGWRGRRSAYFALLGFALVIFTWLGVSFIIPGLHSYAGV